MHRMTRPNDAFEPDEMRTDRHEWRTQDPAVGDREAEFLALERFRRETASHGRFLVNGGVPLAGSW